MQFHVRMIDTNEKEKGAMFDMSKVGKNISELRKRANMTQMELADRMGISFQAVSNWERGQTCPDISKLGELSAILGCTIDELLGNKRAAEVVEAIADAGDQPVDGVTVSEIADIAPLLKPVQIERNVGNLFQTLSRNLAGLGEKIGGKISNVVVEGDVARAGENIADTIEKAFTGLDEKLKEVFDGDREESAEQKQQGTEQTRSSALYTQHDYRQVQRDAERKRREAERVRRRAERDAEHRRRTAERNAEHTRRDAGRKGFNVSAAPGAANKALDLSDVTQLAPFLSEELVEEMALSVVDSVRLHDLAGLAPFLSEKLLNVLAQQAVTDGASVDDLPAVAPFLGEDVLSEIARDVLSRDGASVDDIVSIAPFVDEDVLSDIARDVLSRDGASVDDIVSIAPFVDEDVLGDIARDVLSREGANVNDIVGILPFVDEDVLGDIVINALERGEDAERFISLLPFLSDDTVAEIAHNAIREGGLKAAMPFLPFIDEDMLAEELKNLREESQNDG